MTKVPPFLYLDNRAATSTDFRNRLTGPPNSNRIRLTERFASPYGALCFHVFTDSDSPPGPSRLSLQVVLLLVSNQTSFMQLKRRSKIITCGVLMHKNKSVTWCYSPTVSSRIKQGKESCYSHLRNQRKAPCWRSCCWQLATAHVRPSQTCAAASARWKHGIGQQGPQNNEMFGRDLRWSHSQSVVVMQVNVVWYSARICWLNILCYVPAICQDI